MSDQQLLGIVILSRHGDRTQYYQNPTNYTSTETAITPLGERQNYKQGSFVASRYLNASSDHYIQGIAEVANVDQLDVKADAGGEGNVVLLSAYAFWEGVYPPTTRENITLANGTTVTSPLGGYQYVPVTTIVETDSPMLEPWTSCPAFTKNLNSFYASSFFSDKSTESADFRSNLTSYVGGRNTSLINMYNTFDYMNVNSIHNATYLDSLPDTFLAQTRDLANWHEYYSFSSPAPGGIGNIAGRTLMPMIMDSMNDIVNDDIKIAHYAFAYKPFISVFNMTGADSSAEDIKGIVDYASLAVFELWGTSSDNSSVTVNFLFKNGTDDDRPLTQYPILGAQNVTFESFVNTMEPYGIPTLRDWCTTCNQTSSTMGCDLYFTSDSSSTATTSSDKNWSGAVSPVAAGFIGAVVALAVAALLAGIWGFIIAPKRRRAVVSAYAPSESSMRQEDTIHLSEMGKR
ncbi:phosphoglycerate mutase-like protein [Saitoella complicata NRRL Y-17804]|uniref:phosphoglycerate mutase-like protein n=1 Tax=Saitoella complicata (strain BCRC 22490 / CBS 7301 / JCM 7358 / NBRC 10748 / NRRL Y-17804) TaxID=698492 RepID=UPI00086828BF|nr:phosphoglycerate mutase-like protein [Saitoella complicata NRRL Y-17804]ODQ55758.1 phosphoglycerate mutase-like protein [Saitoella complicata NRRL Y-17804]